MKISPETLSRDYSGKNLSDPEKFLPYTDTFIFTRGIEEKLVFFRKVDPKRWKSSFQLFPPCSSKPLFGGMLFEEVENPKFDTQEEIEIYAESLGKKAIYVKTGNYTEVADLGTRN